MAIVKPFECKSKENLDKEIFIKSSLHTKEKLISIIISNP